MTEALNISPSPVPDVNRAPLVVGLGGTTRPGSSSERLLRAALGAVAERGASTLIFAGEQLRLPLYTPDDPDRSPEAIRMVEALRRADAIIVSSPGYHGSISGTVKNALDHIEDMRGDSRPYLDGRPLGCIACAYGWQAAVATLGQLRTVGHALRAWPTPLGVAANSADQLWGPDGELIDATLRVQLDTLADQLLVFSPRTVR